MIAPPTCYARRCKHLIGVLQPKGDETRELPYCAAFPRGIPAEIAYGDEPHVDPFEGDHGIRYERAEGA